MQRTYLPWLGLGAAVSAGLALGLPAGWAAGVFDSQPLDQSRFAVLAQPVGRSDWKLLVLEQIQTQPLCWERRPDGLIDPALNRFDFTGICSRYLDSNGYSLRVGEQDLASRYRLRLEQQGSSVKLLAMTPSDATELVVGQGSLQRRDRDGFVLLSLEPGWQLQRRSYAGQSLSHVYFANSSPLAQLIARAGGGQEKPNRRQAGFDQLQAQELPAMSGAGPIALQVIPFQP
jgi:hypothetical protein